MLAWRFMHGNELYSLNPGFGESTSMGRLVTLLMEHLHIKVDSTYHTLIFEKVKRFVVYSTRKFIRDYGLLQQFEDGTIRRSPNFDSELQIQTETWKRIHKLSLLVKLDSFIRGGKVLTLCAAQSAFPSIKDRCHRHIFSGSRRRTQAYELCKYSNRKYLINWHR